MSANDSSLQGAPKSYADWKILATESGEPYFDAIDLQTAMRLLSFWLYISEVRQISKDLREVLHRECLDTRLHDFD